MNRSILFKKQEPAAKKNGAVQQQPHKSVYSPEEDLTWKRF